MNFNDFLGFIMSQLNRYKSRVIERPFELKELVIKSKSTLFESKPDPSPLPLPSKRKKLQPLAQTELESIIKSLQSELEAQKKIANSLSMKSQEQQEKLVKREQEYRLTVFNQENKLDQGFSAKDQKLLDSTRQKFEYIYKSHGKIIDKISEIQKKTLKLLEGQESEIVIDMNKKLEEKWDELKTEKIANLYLKGKNKREIELIKELEKYIKQVDGIDETNKKSTEKNFLLKIRQKSHEEDMKILQNQLDNVKNINRKLKNRLRTLRNGRLTPQPFLHDRSPSRASEKEKEDNSPYAEVVKKLKKMIEIEGNNARAARTALSRELEEKKELSKFVKMCVEDVKVKIISKKNEQRMQVSDKSFQSLETTIEVLLSQERVLTLLYDKAFPPRVTKSDLYPSSSVRSFQPSPLPNNT